MVALHASTPSAHAIYDLPLPVAPTIMRFLWLLIYSFVASLSVLWLCLDSASASITNASLSSKVNSWVFSISSYSL